MAAQVFVKSAIRIKSEPGVKGVHIINGKVEVPNRIGRVFEYDHTLGPEKSQADVYTLTVKPMVKQFFEFLNCTVFAYGQTASGKTFTMGTAEKVENPELLGIIPRVLEEVVERANDEGSYELQISYIEFYKKEMYDLLSKKKTKLLVTGTTPAFTFKNLTKVLVNSLTTALTALNSGSTLRETSGTDKNQNSSRSHAVFTLYIKKIVDEDVFKSCFQFIDLAGSEKLSKSHTSKKAGETSSNNDDLLKLGIVISALSKGDKHAKYRDAPITHYLQSSLCGGNAVTLMFGCISSSTDNLDETAFTLEYTEMATKIRTKPIVNVSSKEESERASELKKVRQQLNQLKHTSGQLSKQNQELDQRNRVLEIEKIQLSDVAREANTQLHQLKHTSEQLSKQNQELEQRNRELEIEKIQLSDVAREANTQLRQLQHTSEQLNKQNQELDQRNRKLEIEKDLEIEALKIQLTNVARGGLQVFKENEALRISLREAQREELALPSTSL